MSGRTGISAWRGWAGLVLAPVAWAIHHQAGSDLNFADCRRGDGTVLLLIGLAMLALALLAGAFSFTAWRIAGSGPDRKAARFIPALGLMASGLFSLTLLMQIAAAVILPPCFR